MICKMCGYNVSAVDLKKYPGGKMPMCTSCREEFSGYKSREVFCATVYDRPRGTPDG